MVLTAICCYIFVDFVTVSALLLGLWQWLDVSLGVFLVVVVVVFFLPITSVEQSRSLVLLLNVLFMVNITG